MEAFSAFLEAMIVDHLITYIVLAVGGIILVAFAMNLLFEFILRQTQLKL